MTALNHHGIERLLGALGEQLDAAGEHVGVVIVGGAALLLLGTVRRATEDIDIIAVSEEPGSRPPQAGCARLSPCRRPWCRRSVAWPGTSDWRLTG